MSVANTSRFEHAVLRVRDLDATVAFYREQLGLVEVGRLDDVVYLGCGLDANHQLGLVAGGTGVEHFAIRAAPEQLEQAHARLRSLGVHAERRHDAAPGEVECLRFALPGGTPIELAVVADHDYHRPYRPADPRRLDGIAPLDCDHINLAVENAKTVADFLGSTLGFRVSEALEPDPTADFWPIAFVFAPPGSVHHEIGLTVTRNAGHASLHHLGFQLDDFDHIKRVLDRVARVGINAEFGPSRHGGASNLFCYIVDPGGNRIELGAEMAMVDGSTPSLIHASRATMRLDAWHDAPPPESWLDGT